MKAKYFEGDFDEITLKIQMNVFKDSLHLVINSIIELINFSEIVLSANNIKEKNRYYPDLFKNSYKIMAAKYRFTKNTIQLNLDLSNTNNNIENDWYDWLITESKTFIKYPFIVRAFYNAIIQKNLSNKKKYSDELYINLIEKYDDVPWSDEIIYEYEEKGGVLSVGTNYE